MALFDSLLLLLLFAIALLQVSRKVSIPYPTLLALAGVMVAALPWSPGIALDPRLALALFIAPAILDAAFDLPPRSLRRDWVPLLSLAVLAVLITTAAVAWTAVRFAAMPVASAIALGAIVAPPDAAAASAMLARFSLPRRMVSILKGESLLNDAVALLIFGAAVGVSSPGVQLAHLVPLLALAAPGGIVFGFIAAQAMIFLSRPMVGTLGSTIFQFVACFGVWLIADHLHLSAVLAMVAFAMTIARVIPERTRARHRVHSYAVWEAVVFLSNVLAFLLTGLQARGIVARLPSDQIWHALRFAGLIVVVVVLVRVAWVMFSISLRRKLHTFFREAQPPPSLSQGLVVSWCGMRGLVTLAGALALPEEFPARDLVVLSALGVVLGTLIVQGLTLGPLIQRLRLPADSSFNDEISSARITLASAALHRLDGRDEPAASILRKLYNEERSIAERGEQPRQVSPIDKLRLQLLTAERKSLADLRRAGTIGDDVFHTIEQELDWIELASTPAEEAEMIEG